MKRGDIMDMQQIFSKVFMWLFVGLFLTFGVGYFVQSSDAAISFLAGGGYLIVWIAEIVLALVLVMRIHKMSPLTNTILYLGYAALTGLTFASIFLMYELTSIIYIFGVTSVVLLIFGFIGYKTKLDLTKISTILFMGIIALIILSIVSIFIPSINLAVTLLSLVIFFAYIAYDIQMIKRKMYRVENPDSLAIYGAFQLFLDFINIFLDLLSLFGRERN